MFGAVATVMISGIWKSAAIGASAAATGLHSSPSTTGVLSMVASRCMAEAPSAALQRVS